MISAHKIAFIGAGFAALILSTASGAADWPQWRGGPARHNRSPDKGLLKEWPKGGPPLAWKTTGLGQGYSSVSLANNQIFTMGDQGDSSYVIALDARGKQLWKTKVGKAGESGGYVGPRCTPAYADGLVYALGQFGELVCVDAKAGE